VTRARFALAPRHSDAVDVLAAADERGVDDHRPRPAWITNSRGTPLTSTRVKVDTVAQLVASRTVVYGLTCAFMLLSVETWWAVVARSLRVCSAKPRWSSCVIPPSRRSAVSPTRRGRSRLDPLTARHLESSGQQRRVGCWWGRSPSTLVRCAMSGSSLF